MEKAKKLKQQKIRIMDLAQIGEVLVRLRKKAGLSQKDVCFMSGLTPPQIVGLEKGRIDCQISTLTRYLVAVDGSLMVK